MGFRDNQRGGFGERRSSGGFRGGGFNRGGDRGSRGGFGGRGRGGFGGRDRDGPREMFDATCSKCGKECQVPFKPNGSKPVLCSDCFRSGDAGGSSSFAPRSGGSDSNALSQINAKLDRILAVLSELEIIQEGEGADVPADDVEESDDSDDDSDELA